jgi:phospholipid transport system substrate-binding protein
LKVSRLHGAGRGAGTRPIGIAVCAALVLLGAGAVAGEPPADILGARQTVQHLHFALFDMMKQGQELGYEGRYQRVEEAVRASFDIPFMARHTYGSGWKDLSPEQQAEWIDVFARFHISSIADHREKYRGQVYVILGAKMDSRGTARIHTQLDYPGRDVDLFTDYRLRRRAEGWRIIDVHLPPAVSEVAMRRSEYQRVLERGGFEELVSTMEKRIAARADR